MTQPARPAPKKRPKTKATFVSVLGEIFLTAGALLLLFAFYESFWTNIEAGREQDRVAASMEDRWNKDEATGDLSNARVNRTPALGEAFARMYIPAFGPDFQFAIVEGTSDEDLLAGPGRYVDTQMPGKPGNFAVAGHRVGKGAPFNDLGNLKSCDAVIVETETSWDIYRMLPVDTDDRAAAAAKCLKPEQVERVTSGDYSHVPGREITLPGDVTTIDPIPGLDVAQADTQEGLMTMTTCHPQFSNKERMILHAMLVRTDEKKPGYTPAELNEK
ncbi:class E sortase [Corynebacterium aquilae]|uniref:Housekeeping sortase n=1 Tax=Corynebacterium aquilae DSM 44791 TaxID=1431546 RepID=A0A1L7CIL4_9CORY|nr:class E sortase [Corynebacterium aquilae]APT85694.1 housekeeping sortase [Corynebacterium aquilae DSM 44791]